MIKSKGKTQLKNKEQLANRDRLFFVLNESIPEEQSERKRYVSDIAFFYSTVFKEKIKHFIGLQLEELAQIGRTEEGNNIIRSNINCFRIIDEWCQERTNEHFGNLEEIRDSFETNDDFINKLKNNVN